MHLNEITFSAKIWLYEGPTAWHFVSVPQDISQEIKTVFGSAKRGWGSLPVKVRVGTTVWNTSIFPDSKSGCYLLPLKAEVRKKEHLEAGQEVGFSIAIEV